MINTYLKFPQSEPDVTTGGRVPILNDPGMWLLKEKIFCVKKQGIHGVCWSRAWKPLSAPGRQPSTKL